MDYLIGISILIWALVPFYNKGLAVNYHWIGLWLMVTGGALVLFFSAWIGLILFFMGIGSFFLQLFSNVLVHYR